MALASVEPSGKPDYGLDSPLLVRRMFGRGVWTLVIGSAVFFINRHEYPGPSGSILGVLGAIAAVFFAVGGIMVWSSRVGKLQLRDRLLARLEFEGDEKVLDFGCGRGLMLIGAAKRLKTGKATGVDVWNPEVLSGNSMEAAKENAKIEGVLDRVRLERFDPAKLVYPDNHYDIVMSALAIHNLGDGEDRDQAVREMYRVLKPNGRLVILDILYTGRYAKVLRACDARDVALSAVGFLWCVPTRSLMARK